MTGLMGGGKGDGGEGEGGGRRREVEWRRRLTLLQMQIFSRCNGYTTNFFAKFIVTNSSVQLATRLNR